MRVTTIQDSSSSSHYCPSKGIQSHNKKRSSLYDFWMIIPVKYKKIETAFDVLGWEESTKLCEINRLEEELQADNEGSKVLSTSDIANGSDLAENNDF